MKIKLFILMFAMIFLVGTISAELSLDNVVQYDENTQTVTIVNTFGLGRDLAEIKLVTPLNYKVAVGYNKVAELKFINFDDTYTNALEEIEFYNARKGMSEITRNFDFRYAEDRIRQVPIYENQCHEELAFNGTISVCENVVIGTKNESYTTWVLFDKIEDLPTTNIPVGIFTDVKQGDVIEWIPKFYGKKIDEWAVWTADLNVDIILYLKLDENATIIIDSTGNQNGTRRGAVNVTGKINSAYTFGAGNDITMGDYNAAEGGNLSVSLWAKTGTVDANDVIVMKRTAGLGYVLQQGVTNKFRFQYETAGGEASAISTTNILLNNTWQHIVFTYDGTTGRIYINGVSEDNETTISGNLVSSAANLSIGEHSSAGGDNWNGEIDEIGLWNRSLNVSEVLHLYNNNTGISFTTDFDNDPVVTLNSPINAFNTTNATIVFNGTASDDINLTNVSLIIDGVLNETNSSGINNSDYIFTKIIADGNHNWTYEAFDNESKSTIATTRNFTIDTILPIIQILAPNGTLNEGIVGGNETLNWSINDTNLDTCFFDYNGTNVTVTCSDNSTNFLLEFDNYNLTMWANDTLGNINNSFTSWNYNFVIINQTFNNQTIEGNVENFTLFVQSNQQISTIDLIYNGTPTNAVIVNTGNFIYSADATKIIPSVSADINHSFFWNIVLADTTEFNTSSNNQTVLNVGIDNCSVFTTTIFNYTVIDEENQNILANTTVEIDIDINAFGTTTTIIDFSQLYNNTNPATVCLNINLTGDQRYSIVSTVRYQSEDPDHANEYYNIDNFTLQNSTIPQNINLFDLLSNDSVEFQITFKDDFFLPVEGALVHIIRQYVSEGVFKTVEIPITDSNGQAVAHLVRNDVVYNILITKGNQILGTFNNIIAFCQDIIIGDCRINLNSVLQEAEIYDFETSTNLLFTLDYDDPTRTITLDFTTIDGSTRNVTLQGTVLDGLGTTTPCFESLTSSTGIITCVVPVSVGNATLFIDIHVSGQSVIFSTVIQIGESLFFGSNGYFLMFFLVLSLALMFSGSKTGTIIGVIIGFIGASALGLFKGGIMGIGSAVIWLIIAGIILIWRLNREGST